LARDKKRQREQQGKLRLDYEAADQQAGDERSPFEQRDAAEKEGRGKEAILPDDAIDEDRRESECEQSGPRHQALEKKGGGAERRRRFFLCLLRMPIDPGKYFRKFPPSSRTNPSGAEAQIVRPSTSNEAVR
jgi:hypothetical protein